MGSSKRKSKNNHIVYQEFGQPTNSAALERGITDLPDQEQKLRVQASRKGRKGKTVTIISGFQAKPETLATLLKQLKSYCGAGGTVKENTIEIQGDHCQKLVEQLVNLGYQAKVS